MADKADDSADDDRTRFGVVAPVAVPGAVPSRPAAQTPAHAPTDVDAGDSTQVLPAWPPPLSGTRQSARESQPDSEDASDRTQVLSVPPPSPRPPIEQPKVAEADQDRDGGDRTQMLVSPAPSAIKPAAAQSAATASSSTGTPAVSPQPSAAPAPTAVAPSVDVGVRTAAATQKAAPGAVTQTQPRASTSTEFDDDRTVVLRRVESTLKLVRVPPTAGNAEPIALDRPKLVIGRGRQADIKLYSPTSSREHAVLQEVAGRWTIEPIDGRSVLIDDTVVETETELQPGMKIRLGDDELVVALATAGGTKGQGSPSLLERLLTWWKGLKGRARG